MFLTQNQWVHCFYFSIPKKFFSTVEVVKKDLMKPKETIWHYNIRLKGSLVQLFTQTKIHRVGPTKSPPPTQLTSLYLSKPPPLVDFPDVTFCSHYMVSLSSPSFHIRCFFPQRTIWPGLELLRWRVSPSTISQVLLQVFHVLSHFLLKPWLVVPTTLVKF